MPKDKDLKRLVRARMEKTGEAYTTARARLLEQVGAPKDAELTLAAVAGYSEEIVKARSGCSWEKWVRFLDARGAAELPHREIAELAAKASPKMSGWWAQAVTVGYERIKGLREIGQRRSGSYDANKSKTYGVPVDVLYAAFSDARRRRRWLPDADWRVRTSTPGKSIRVDWTDGTRVQFWFTAKGEARSSVAVQHGGHRSKAASERSKAFWGERLTALAGSVSAASG